MSKKHKTRTINSVDTIEEAGWDSGIKTAKFCGRCDKTNAIIRLMPEVHEKIQALNDALDSLNIEWLGYLLGESKDNIYTIDAIEIPEQTVTGASVVVAENYSNERLVGTVHLHPFATGTFFSGTDEEHIGQNHDIMIVTTPSGQYKGSCLVALECGASMRADAKVEVLGLPNPELDEFLKLAGDKIKVRKVEATRTYGANEPQSDYQYQGRRYPAALYCGKCHKKLLVDEMTIYREGVELCMPCHNSKDKQLSTPGGMACHDCKEHTAWAGLLWEQGVARCGACHAIWRNTIEEGKERNVVALENW